MNMSRLGVKLEHIEYIAQYACMKVTYEYTRSNMAVSLTWGSLKVNSRLDLPISTRNY